MAEVKSAVEVKLSRLSSGGLFGVYTIVTSATDDWCVLSDFEEVQWAKAYTTADGTNQEAYTDGSNKVYLDVPGTATMIVVGKSIKSTGGAT